MTPLNREDIDLHIMDLIELGEDPKTEAFWRRVAVFAASCCEYEDRKRFVTRLVLLMKKYTGRKEE